MREAKKLRPYQLPRAQYALWHDIGVRLGINAQVAAEQYLCDGRKMTPPHGGELDERSRTLIRELAAKRGVLIPSGML